MNIAVIGAGYVGLVTSACFSDLGNHVTCIDIDEKKIAGLRKGILPIYEPGLQSMVVLNQGKDRLHFETSFSALTDSPQLVFIAVGTPSDEDGSADMQYVLAAARSIAEHMTEYCIIVDKSTVPVGVANQVEQVIHQTLQKRGLSILFDVVSNPEFLREGAAIGDFMKPDRVVIGCATARAKDIMLDLYMPIMRSPERIYFMSVKDAEMTKYVANAMLATRISFMNEVAVLCGQLKVDVENVRLGIGSDSRIGDAFIQPGCGYGGSCFPKDVKALINIAMDNGVEPLVLLAVEERNRRQKRVLSEKIIELLGNDLSRSTIAVWGLSFKPGTDDMRDASSLVLLEELIQHQAHLRVYDPVAMPAAKALFPEKWVTSNQLVFVDDQYEALDQADAMIMVTEWQSFCYPDFQKMKERMRGRCIVLDGRNQYDPTRVRAAGFEYYGIGR